MKNRTWEYIGGHQWSLVEKNGPYDSHLCSIEIEKGKYPIVVYLVGGIDKDELQSLLEIIKEEYE